MYAKFPRNFQQIKSLTAKKTKNGRKMTEKGHKSRKVFNPKTMENRSNNGGRKGPISLMYRAFSTKHGRKLQLK
jgi:ribosomal protein L28